MSHRTRYFSHVKKIERDLQKGSEEKTIHLIKVNARSFMYINSKYLLSFANNNHSHVNNIKWEQV